MSSTNKTTYYELPQFVDNDIFNPLVDDNDAYSKIDTALHNIANAEADDASEIVSVKSRLDSAERDIDALEAQNGNSVLTTTAQTLSGAVNELDAELNSLDGRLDTVEDDINNVSTGLKAKVNALEQQNGSEPLDTEAQTLSGAINELSSESGIISNRLDLLENLFVNVKSYGAKGDGVTDDTEAISNAYAESKHLYFPKGVYLLTAPLVLTSDTRLVGYGATLKSVHKILSCENYNTTPYTDTSNIIIEGLSFNNDGSLSTAIELIHVKNIILKDLTVYGQGESSGITTAVAMADGCENIVVDNCNIYGDDYALITAVNENNVDNYVNKNIRVSNCKLSTGHGTAFAINQGNKDIEITNCNINIVGTVSLNGIGIKCQGETTLDAHPNAHVDGLNISNCSFNKETTATGATAGVSYGHGATNIAISNCTFNGLSTAIVQSYMQTLKAMVAITNCNFNECLIGIDHVGGGNAIHSVVGCHFKGGNHAINGDTFYIKIANCDFIGIEDVAINFKRVNNNVVDNNLFQNCKKTVIGIGIDTTGENSRVSITNNMFHECVLFENNEPVINWRNCSGVINNNYCNSSGSEAGTYKPDCFVNSTGSQWVRTGNYLRAFKTGFIVGTDARVAANNAEVV